MYTLNSTIRGTVKRNESTNCCLMVKPSFSYALTMDTKAEVGKRIRIARKKAKLTLKQTAEAIPELSITRLQNFEKGLRAPDLDLIKKISAALNSDPAWIATFIDEPVDQQEKELIQKFKVADSRGKTTIIMTAEHESYYGKNENPSSIKKRDFRS